MNFKNFPMVSNVVFGRGSFNQIDEIIAPKRQNELAPFIYLIDDVFKEDENILSKISLAYYDYIILTTKSVCI